MFKGRVKSCYIAPIIDKVLARLASWKGSCLSMAGRLVLVKSVIHSMTLYTLAIYKWPSADIKLLERACRNFIWSGCICSRKMCVVSWKKSCQPLSNGGLGLRSLRWLNEASNMKMMFDILYSHEGWVVLIRNRVIKHYGCIRYHVYSSIWTSVKAEYNNIVNNSCWIIGSGTNVSFWTDSWSGEPFIDDTSMDVLVSKGINPHIRISDLSHNGQWCIPPIWFTRFPFLCMRLDCVSSPSIGSSDTMGWKHSMTGSLEMKEAYRFKETRLADVPWSKALWHINIPPSRSILV